ncbi:MAG: DUF4230 domain-containing protein [Actinobacteria bacterium]|nr:DUF4230 domain-containing protein [Actinomycetota bacterium]
MRGQSRQDVTSPTAWERPGGAPSSPTRSRAPLAALAVVVLLLGVGVTKLGDLLPSFGNPFAADSVDRSQPALLEAIEDLSEYRAATGQFQVIMDVEDDTRFVPSFIRGERTVFLAGGTVDASVDFAGLATDAIEVSDDGTSVTVRLPPARLSQPRIDPERSYVVDRERGLLDRAGSLFSDNPTSERDLYLLAEEKLSAAAAEADLVERAEANTRRMLESMLGSLGYSEVTVIFEDDPAL